MGKLHRNKSGLYIYKMDSISIPFLLSKSDSLFHVHALDKRMFFTFLQSILVFMNDLRLPRPDHNSRRGYILICKTLVLVVGTYLVFYGWTEAFFADAVGKGRKRKVVSVSRNTVLQIQSPK